MSRNRMRQEVLKYDVNLECEKEVNSTAVRKCSRMNVYTYNNFF